MLSVIGQYFGVHNNNRYARDPFYSQALTQAGARTRNHTYYFMCIVFTYPYHNFIGSLVITSYWFVWI